jgi:hypothetical protein
MAGGDPQGVPPKSLDRPAVFLNIPYDMQFHRLCLAYICGVASFGLIPRATLEIPGARRLDRILELIEECPFSLHDLSRVQLSSPTPRVPRFNMPFELGLAVEWQRQSREHAWYVFETQEYRSHRSLSDLAGTDVYIHGGTIEGVLTQLSNAFIRERRKPSFSEMMRVYRTVRAALPSILARSGSRSIFAGARSFRDVCVSAADVADTLIRP